MPETIVGLGANLGDARRTLELAVKELRSEPGISDLTVSAYYRTSPVDSSGPDYVNAAVKFKTALTPEALLTVCQKIENKYGRVRPAGVVNAPRTLDLDVLWIEGVTRSSPELTIPHPRMIERLFVLLPLRDLLPDWHAPDGRSVGEVIRGVEKNFSDQKIEKLMSENMA